MKNLKKRILLSAVSGLLCVSTALSLSGCGESDGEKPSEGTDQTPSVADRQDAETDTYTRPVDPSGVAYKDETVYAFVTADGTVNRVIVTDRISNPAGKDTLSDFSNLSDIFNVKGDETYTAGENGALTWQANGDDICYRGNSNSELPLHLSVTYLLDGESISPADLAGKSGKVTVRYTYTNTCKVTVDRDGTPTEVTVPFAVVTGMLLDSDIFSNVKVVNGKAVSDGSRTAVVGFALPGFAESLNIPTEDGNLAAAVPTYFEFSADVHHFSLGETMTFATNSLFGELDLTDADSAAGDLNEKIAELSGAMDQLVNGSAQILQNYAQLKAGLDQLTGNSDELCSGALTVFGTFLHEVESKLAENGLTVEALTPANYTAVLKKLLTDPNESQKAAMIALADSGLNKQLADVPENYRTAAKVMLADAISGGATVEQATAAVTASLQKALTVSAAATDADAAAKITALCTALATDSLNQSLRDGKVPEQMFSAAKVILADRLADGETMEQATASLAAILNDAQTVSAVAADDTVVPDPTVYAAMTEQGADADTAGLIAKLCTALAAQKGGEANQYVSDAQSMAQNASVATAAASDPNAETKINQLTGILAEKAETQLNGELEKAGVPADCLSAAKVMLYDLIGEGNDMETAKGILSDRLNAAAAVTAAANDSTAKAKVDALCLSLARQQLQPAVNEALKQLDSYAKFYNGLLSYTGGVDAAALGAAQLLPYLQQLTDGIGTLNTDAVQKLLSLYRDTLAPAGEDLQAMAEAISAYRSFGGIADDMAGSVKFIIQTAAIG